MKYILDEEVNLNRIDLLNSRTYASTVKEAIINTPKDKSFTIGLFGEWGSGKSSIIQTVKNELENQTQNKKIKFIIYDAWKYSKDSFRRMFLLKVQEELKFDRTDLMNSFYLNESEDVKIRKRFSLFKMLIIATILLIGVLIINFSGLKPELNITIAIVFSFLGLFTTLFYKAFDELKDSIQKPHLFAPEQFEECFNEMIEKSMRKYSMIETTISWVKGENYVKNIDKFVIVIDNIDRCQKELAYELLTNTKNFLGNRNNVIFLIPVDDEALKNQILKGNSNSKEAEEFLRKFFNLTIRIKPFKPIEIFDFANKLNKDYKLNFNPDTVDIVSKEYASNPRRIIQFFNNLISELDNFKANFDEKFTKKNESIIAMMLIIREEWPKFYSLISRKPHLFNDSDDDKEKLLNDNKELSQFLENTKAVSKGIDIKLVEQILSNSKSFLELPVTIISAISNSKLKEIEDYIKDNSSNQELALKYLIEELKNGIISKRFKTSVQRTFTILLSLNQLIKFSIPDNHKIQNVINGNLHNFIESITECGILISYTKDLFNQKITYLSDFIISSLQQIFDEEKDKYDEFWTEIIDCIIFNFPEPAVLKKIKIAFAKYFSIQNNYYIQTS